MRIHGFEYHYVMDWMSCQKIPYKWYFNFKNITCMSVNMETNQQDKYTLDLINNKISKFDYAKGDDVITKAFHEWQIEEILLK